MKGNRLDIAIGISIFAVAWGLSSVVFPGVRIRLAFFAAFCVWFHLVMLGFMRMDDIEPQHTARAYFIDHSYALRGPGLLYLIVCGALGLAGIGHA